MIMSINFQTPKGIKAQTTKKRGLKMSKIISSP